MKLPQNIKVFGDTSYRGRCPSESLEQVTFFARLRREYPELAKVAIHPRNEGQRHHAQTMKQKAEGMTKGASDIIIPMTPAFVCELKRRDHAKSTISSEQIEYLEACQSLGSFACVALGCDAAFDALKHFLK